MNPAGRCLLLRWTFLLPLIYIYIFFIFCMKCILYRIQCTNVKCSSKLPLTTVYICSNYRGSGGSVVKNPPASAGETYSIPGSGSSPGGGNCNPLQYSSLENPMDREVWWGTVFGVTKCQTLLSN